MKIKKNHIYSVIYKGQEVYNYLVKEPLNKEGWILGEPRGYSPLPDSVLKELINDPEVTIIDGGVL